MKTLKFRPELAQLILEGKKTTTWRLFDDKDLTAGDVIELINKETLEVFGYVTIVKIAGKAMKDLGEEDWEGHERFPNDEAMYAAYRDYYPGQDIGPDAVLKIVHFSPVHFFDAHTHVQFSAYGADGDRDAVLVRANEADVFMINVGTQRDTSAAAIALAEAHAADGVYAAVGLHPIHTGKSHHDENELGGGEAAKTFVSRGELFDYDYYKKLAEHPRVVAIGECGLDYFHFDEAEPQETQIVRQKEAFAAQMKLSRDVDKALMIHCRDAFADVIELLRAAGPDGYTPGVVHFFTGTVDDARAFLDLGFSFTFGGAVTFPPRKGMDRGSYDDVIKFIPADRIISETDAPYVAPVQFRGKRNEPSYIPHIVARLAELKGVSAEEMKAQIWENAKRVFRIS